MQDGFDFPRDFGLPTRPITVEPAQKSYKKHQDDVVAEDQPSSKPKNRKAKAMAKKKAEELNARLADWSDDEPSAVQQTGSRFDKVVVMQNVFTPGQIKTGELPVEDIVEDMLEGCEEFGKVKNVTVFDLEEDGFVTVRFADVQAAQACVARMDGRSYNHRCLRAWIATGVERFKKTRKSEKDKEAEEAKRLEKFGNDIEDNDADVTATGSADT